MRAACVACPTPWRHLRYGANISFATPFTQLVGSIRVTIMNPRYLASAVFFRFAAIDPDVSADCLANCIGEASGERTVSVLVQNLASVGEAGAGMLVAIDDTEYRGRLVKVGLAPDTSVTISTTIVVELKPPPVAPLEDEVYSLSLMQAESTAQRVKFVAGRATVFLWLSIDASASQSSTGDGVTRTKAAFEYSSRPPAPSVRPSARRP